MKRQWRIRREVQEYPNGQSRWDRAYLLVLEITRDVEMKQMQTAKPEVQNASSNLRTSLDPASSSSSND